MDPILNGLMGILGGIVGSAVVAILTQRKNNAEIVKLQAETRRINQELESTQNHAYREMLAKLHDYLHLAVGRMTYLTRPVREYPLLGGKSDEEITAFLQESKFTEYEIGQVLKTPDRNQAFYDITLWHDYLEAETTRLDYHNFLVTKKIFIDNQELLETCAKLDELMLKVLDVTRRNITRIYSRPVTEIYTRWYNELGPLVGRIEELLQPDLRAGLVGR